MSQEMRNESGKSKKNAIFVICLRSGGGDNMKRSHFHRMHPDKKYFEKGEKLAKTAKDFCSVSPLYTVLMSLIK